MLVDLLIRNAYIITMDPARTVYRNGCLAVHQGRIVAVGRDVECAVVGQRTVSGAGQILMPGLVNAHDHLAQSIFRGVLDEAPPTSVRPSSLFHLSRALTAERAEAAALVTLTELTRFGVTTTHDSHFTNVHRDSIEGVCQALRESQLRGVVARAINDTDALPADYRESIDEVVTELDRLRATWNSATLEIIPEAVGTLRNTPAAIQAMHAYAVEHDCLWHMHLAQNFGERDATIERYGHGCVELLDQWGVLDDRLLAAHCVGVTDHEVVMLGRAGVRVAHCPLAQLYRGSRIAPILEMRAAGATVAVGVDGAGTNNGQNPWETMKIAVFMQKYLAQDFAVGSAELGLELATIEAARALDVQDRVGSLEMGKDADLLLIDRADPSLFPEDTLPSHFAHAFDPRGIHEVIIRGETVWADGEHRFLDTERIVADARAARQAMLAELGDPYPRRSPWTVVD